MKTRALLNSFLKLTCGLLVALSTAACARSGNDERIARASTGTAPSGQVSTRASACSTPAGVVGRIYDDASTASTGSFESRVKGLISANYDPMYIGTIEGINGASATCVTLEGALAFNSSGELDLVKSKLKMKVYDSFAEKLDTSGNAAGAYPIEFSGAQSGRREANGTFTAVFSDALGSVSLSGQITHSQVLGVIQYSNAQIFSGGAGLSGVLGAFSINTASFIQ